MKEAEFKRQLEADGYGAISVVDWDANTINDRHSHDFAARGLVLSGRFVLACEGREQACGPGDVFELDAGIEHVETVGPEGARFLVGRK